MPPSNDYKIEEHLKDSSPMIGADRSQRLLNNKGGNTTPTVIKMLFIIFIIIFHIDSEKHKCSEFDDPCSRSSKTARTFHFGSASLHTLQEPPTTSLAALFLLGHHRLGNGWKTTVTCQTVPTDVYCTRCQIRVDLLVPMSTHQRVVSSKEAAS